MMNIFAENIKLIIKTLAKFLLLLSTAVIITSCKVDIDKSISEEGGKNYSAYDSLTAQKWDADKYGMKKYVFAFLKRGTNKEKDSVKAAELQAAHLKNIGRMAEDGKLVLAGPFMDDGDLRGIYVFNVESVEEAEQLTMTDPAIKAGVLTMELKPWYGSAALMGLNDLHESVSKENP